MLEMPAIVPYSHSMDFQSHIEYALFRLVRFGLGSLPLNWSTAILRLAARMAGLVVGVRRKVVSTQLQNVFPKATSKELAVMVAKVYDHLGVTAAEVLFADPVALARTVIVEPGWDVLDQALAGGGGAIVVTGHIGNFELGGRVLAGRYSLLDVVKTQRNAPFDRFLQQQRLRFGIRTVPVERSGRAVLAHLRSGGLVTLLMDQDAGKTGFRTDFLGHPASTWPGAAKISIRTGCPVVPIAILRNEDRTHTLHVGQAMSPRGMTDTDEDIKAFTGLISKAVERFIWDRPEQWFWVHRRWKGAAEARGADEPIQGI